MRVLRLTICALALWISACGNATEPSDPDGVLSGGVLATFAVGTDQFKVWITDAAAINRVLALSRGEPGGQIPNGRILRGTGQGAHNAPFSWHLDPADIQVVDVAIELCDGTPRFVEQNLAEYVDRITRYCPWGARLVAVTDYR